MEIKDNFKIIFSDTQVPDVFISDYLPSLTAPAVKLYLYALLLAKSDRKINQTDLKARIGISTEELKVLTVELASYGLISMTENGLVLEDVKALELQKIYKPRSSADPSAKRPQRLMDEREQVLMDINKTFFSGLMGPSWYYEVENWFDKYEFEPQVVYALFNECKIRKKLNSKAYISKVAANWAANGVKTFDDLNVYSATFDKVKGLAKKIRQKLRKNITAYDEELIQSWVQTMDYDFSVIDLALRRTSKLANPNLQYANALLEEWFSRGLKTAPEIEAYEAEKRKRFAASGAGRSRQGRDAKKANVGNFTQRKYSEEYFESMLDDLAEEEAVDNDEKN